MKTELISIDRLKYASEAPPELGLQVRKSRDSTPTSDAELRASLKTHGLLSPLLVVDHKQDTYVVAGNRRLRLMRDLGITKAEIANATDYGEAREVALASNVVLPPHPVDRHEVIAGMISDGMTPEDAKQRFGMTDRSFAQVMRLGNMSSMVREAWRSGAIDGETARAFALTDDQKMQEKVFVRLSKGGNSLHANMVRHQFVGQQRDVGASVSFVGFAACDEHKVGLVRDLFGDNHTVKDHKKLAVLVQQVLAGIAADLVENDGWSWATLKTEVQNSFEYADLSQPKLKMTKEEKARAAEIVAKLASVPEGPMSDEERALLDEHAGIERAALSRAYSADDKAKAGCFVSMNHVGDLKVEFGKVKPRAKTKDKPNPKKKAEVAVPGEATLSNNLATRLSEQLQIAMAETIKGCPSVACAALLAGFAGGGPVNVRVGGGAAPSEADFLSVLNGALTFDEPRLMSMLAQVAAEAIDVRVSHGAHMPLTSKTVVALCAALPDKVLAAATLAAFDPGDYFSSVSRDAIADAAREAMGDDAAASVGKMTKKQAVDFALANVQPTGWLPQQLRTAGYAGPSPKVKAPPEKPESSKKPAKKAVKKAAKKPAKKSKR